MIEHRNPDCVGLFELAKREGVTCDKLTPKTAAITCKHCGTLVVFTRRRWMEALRHNLTGLQAMNESAIGRRILEREKKGREGGDG